MQLRDLLKETLDTFDVIRQGFENGRWPFGQHERIMWKDLQNHVTQDTIDLSEEAKQFSEWVTSVDFSEIMNRSSPSTRDRLVRAVYRRIECLMGYIRCIGQ